MAELPAKESINLYLVRPSLFSIVQESTQPVEG